MSQELEPNSEQETAEVTPAVQEAPAETAEAAPPAPTPAQEPEPTISLSKHKAYIEAAKRGILDEEIFDAFHDRAPKDSDFGAWLDELKDDPSKAPKILQPHVPVSKPTNLQHPQGPRQLSPAPAKSAPGIESLPTDAQILEVAKAAHKTGDFAEYLKLTNARNSGKR